MALVLNEQYLEGFVTREELEAYSGPLQEAHRRLHAPDGQPKGWLDLPGRPGCRSAGPHRSGCPAYPGRFRPSAGHWDRRLLSRGRAALDFLPAVGTDAVCCSSATT